MNLARLRKMLGVRQAYKRTFSTEEGKVVLCDLIRKYIIADPAAAEDAEAIMVNVGMQRAAVYILKHVYGNDDDLRAAIEREIEQAKHTQGTENE